MVGSDISSRAPSSSLGPSPDDEFSSSSSKASSSSSSSPTSATSFLLDRLYDPSDSDFNCPLYEFILELQKVMAAEGTPLASVSNEYLVTRAAELKREEDQVQVQLSVQQHAKEKLLVELKRTEAAIEALQNRAKLVRQYSKFTAAAMQKLVAHEVEAHLKTLGSLKEGESQKVEAMSWLLRAATTSRKVKDDVLITGLQHFENMCILAEEDSFPSQLIPMWTTLVENLIQHLFIALPKLQLIELRILTEIAKRASSSASLNSPQPQSPSGGYASLPICDLVMGDTHNHNDDIPSSSSSSSSALALLVRLLRSVNEEVKTEAAQCVTAVCTSIESKEAFGRLGGIEALIGILNRSNNEAVLTQALITLWNQSVADSNKTRVRLCDGIASVLGMLHVDNETILENATIALGYLTRDDTNKAALRECGGIEQLLATLRYPNESIQSIATLVELLSSPFESVQENAAGGLWNCAVDPENKKQHTVFCFRGGVQAPERHGNLYILVAKGRKLSTMRGAGNCSAVPENRVMLRKLGGLPPLLKLLRSTQLSIQENVAGALRNCAFNDQNKIEFRELGGIPIFIEMLSHPRDSIVEKVVSTLMICTVNAENKDAIRLHGGFPKLVACLAHTDPTIREKAAGALRNCTSTTENRLAVIHCQGVLRLIQLLNSPADSSTAPTREYAASTLWNLAREDPGKMACREAGGIVTLIKLLQDPQEAVVENAAGALLSLTTNAENRDAVRLAGGLHHLVRNYPLLVRLLRTTNMYALENVLGALKNCTTGNESNQILVCGLGGLDPLLNTLNTYIANHVLMGGGSNSGSNGPSMTTGTSLANTSAASAASSQSAASSTVVQDNVVRETILVLKNLASNDENNAVIGKMGAVNALARIVHTLPSTDLVAKVAAFALQTMSRNAQNREVMDRAQG